jgi:predicted enzyme related to lactoylglutathione lyase
MSHGTFYWNELMTHDVEGAKRFYASTMGWTYEAMEMDGGDTYWVAKVGDQPVGGILAMSGDFGNRPDTWLSYIAVDNVDARLGKAKGLGARVAMEPIDVPGVGRIAVIEAGGALIGLMTPDEQSQQQ